MSESASPYSSTSTTAATTNTQRNPTRASMSTTTTSSSSSSRHNNSNNNNQPTPPTTASGGGWRANNIISGNTRPASELLGSHPTTTHPFASPETEAIDRWFADLQHYESTLEEMASASLDANFAEELSAIEQWFRVLSEAERTAALYSLLQSSTQVQMRFFVTVLQQMARADPMTALLSPAKPGQASMESQMEAKLSSLGLKSPATPMSAVSPAIRQQFARQSLGAMPSSTSSATETYLSPHHATSSYQQPASAHHSLSSCLSSTTSNNSTINANDAPKYKAGSRISAPANILLGSNSVISDGLKSPLWIENRERNSLSASSSANRPKSIVSNTSDSLSQSAGPPPNSAYLRASMSSPAANTSSLDGQLSPIVGGSWASMTSTPLVPMFGRRDGEDGIAPGDYGSPQPGQESPRVSSGAGGIVLDDVRKFRRSARISASGMTLNAGGALGGMYEDQLPRRPLSLTSMQQSSMNLGLQGHHSAAVAGSQQQQRSASPGPLSASTNNSASSQQTAVAAQTNWRNGLGSPNTNQQHSQLAAQTDLLSQQLASYHLNPHNSPSMMMNQQQQHGGLGGVGGGQLSANAQLANLFALQQQMLQQQQFQSLNLAAAAAGLSTQQLMALQAQQNQSHLLSPRMAGGMMGMGGGGGMAMGHNNYNSGQSRRSPRPHELRSPNPRSPMSPATSSSTPAATPGSGTNPLENLDMTLLSDVPNWLRSLRLHKYTTNFEGSRWQEMVLLDEAGLESKGVAAVGARRKLLKVFETVRSKTGLATAEDKARAATIANGGGGDAQQKATTNVSPTLSATEDA